MSYSLNSLFSIKDKVAVVTGGGGIICGEMAKSLGALGAKVAILDLNPENANKLADEINSGGGTAIGIECNVLKIESLQQARDIVLEKFATIDFLVNGAGGNSAKATTGGTNISQDLDPTFFDLDQDGIRFVFDLNFLGTLLPTQVFGKCMVDAGSGSIINITSMNAFCPLTKIPAYSAAKAAVSNFTQWLSVHFAPAGIRVNSIAPGFFLTDQNRFLLTDKDTGEATPRGETILSQTPAGRYGTPDELVGALIYLVSPAASFVTGTTMAVDGGFSAFSGV